MGNQTLRERVLNQIPGTVVDVDGRYSGGPAHALICALRDADSVSVAGVVAVDMPFVGEALAALTDAWPRCSADGLVVRSPDGRAQWLCAVYRADTLLHAAANLSTDGLGMFHLTNDLSIEYVDVPDAVVTMDVDTVADLEHAEREINGR